MTITYTGSVATSRLFGFSRLLFYWRGSIYKLMYKEMLIFCAIYASLSLMYRFILGKDGRETFEQIALYCEGFSNLIPLSFVLGFYVAICVGRWWNQYTSIPWPDRMMMFVTTMIEGADERGKILRRTIMRYLSLSSLIVFQATSVVVKKRFPTMEHLMDAGLITQSEVNAMNDVQTPHGKWWVPTVWICNLIKAARKEGRIADNYLMKTLIEEVQTYRGNLGMLFSYDWISVPLVYTQVTTLAVYSFFLSCILGRQFLDPKKNYPGHEVDLYVPMFTLLQFFFYMGWLKVAEQLINPFGEDDDDFEINWVIDRNLQVSLIVADDMYDVYPNPEKDVFFDETAPDNLPYTKSTIDTISRPHMGSTADLSVSSEGMKIVTPMETIQENQTNPTHHATQGSHYPAYHPTPLSTPATNRRLYPNMIIGCGMFTPLEPTKTNVDEAKTSGRSDSSHSRPDHHHPTHGLNMHKHKPLGYSSSMLQNQFDGLAIPSSSGEHGSVQLGTSVDSALTPKLPRSPRSPRATSPINVPKVVVEMDSKDGIPSRKSDFTHVQDSSVKSSVFVIQSEVEDGKQKPPVQKPPVQKPPVWKPVPSDTVTCDTAACDTVLDMPDEVISTDNHLENAASPCSGSETRFDVCAVEDDTYPDTVAEPPLLSTILEAERNRHSSEEQAGDYMASNNSSVSSFTPLLRSSKVDKDFHC